MVLSKRLKTRERTSSFWKRPKVSGISPEKLLPVRSRYLRLERSGRVLGSAPVRRF
ncbi:hypothetical protein Pyn_30431 [Prunus yedoensis var. nudiflora]|uniref:Uncharacterized protein n=1 Tax=Prunus yedoensis var. nudiflora TaxID=2094558 RepID=A0A314ZLY1_PRUYE|nr:hypothetical protein Pyn_30431 [Prunus yedoensis var. nudiflora]